MVGIRLIIFSMMMAATFSHAQSPCTIEIESDSSDYNSLKASVNKRRSSMLKEMYAVSDSHKEVFMDSVGNIIHRIISEQMLSAWHGTEWTFSGYTAVPKQGTIACGYFVSTTLRDMGFNLDRYKLAQKSPLGEGRSLYLGEDPISIHEDSLMHYVSCLADGLYFLGLSNHVGYLSIEGGDPYFIHSNYINAAGVIKERLECSQAVEYSFSYLLVPLSTNQDFVSAWLNNKRFTIYKE